MSDLTNRLSKAVWEYLDTANLRSEPFSLSRIEEVIAGVMATDSKVPVNVVRHPEYLAQQKVLEQAKRKAQQEPPTLPNVSTPGTIKAYLEHAVRLQSDQIMEVNRNRHADFIERYKAQLQEPTAPVTYDLAKDPDAFKKARVGDVVECSRMCILQLGSSAQEFLNKSVEEFELRHPVNRDVFVWTRIA